MEKEFTHCTPRSVIFESKIGSSLVSKVFPFLLNGNEFCEKVSKVNVILAILIVIFYIYVSMIPSTVKTFRNNFKNEVDGDFLSFSEAIFSLLIINCDNPTEILQTPPFYIFALLCTCYVIYFIIVIFCQNYHQNKHIQSFLFLLSGPIPSVPLFLNFANCCFSFSFYANSENMHKWMYLFPIIFLVLSLPGIFLALAYNLFLIKHVQRFV